MNKLLPTLETLDNFFTGRKIPKEVQLHTGIKIFDTAVFLESHFAVLKTQGLTGIYEVFHRRLARLKEIVSLERENEREVN